MKRRNPDVTENVAALNSPPPRLSAFIFPPYFTIFLLFFLFFLFFLSQFFASHWGNVDRFNLTAI